MLKALILICAAALDHGACTVKTADSVIATQADSLQGCMFGGQAKSATAEGLFDRKTQYLKVVCVMGREAAR